MGHLAINRAIGSRPACALLVRRALSTTATLGKTFALQPSLPPLPLPPLEHTLAKYEASLQPLLSKDEAASASAAIRDSLPALELLQKRLKRNASAEKNWIERGWDVGQYLQPRSPLPINYNYFLRFADAPTGMDDASKDLTHLPPLLSPALLRRASALLRCMMSFHCALADEVIATYVDPRSGRPLDMIQFGRLFGHTRIPRSDRDWLQCFGPVPSMPEAYHFATEYVTNYWTSSHVAIIANGHLFMADVFDDDGVPLPASAIARSLGYIITAADVMGPAEYPLGALTTLRRDQWAEARQQLIVRSPTNEAALDRIDTALWVVTLDAVDASSSKGAHDKPQSSDEALSQRLNRDSHRLLVGRGDGSNCWFDKHQLMVGSDGSAGLLLEHAPVDGATVLRLMDFVQAAQVHASTQSSADSRRDSDMMMGVPSSYCPSVTDLSVDVGSVLHELHPYMKGSPLHRRFEGRGLKCHERQAMAQQLLADTGGAARLITFDIPPTVHVAIENARKTFVEETSALTSSVLHFTEFGADTIKAAGLPPDSFVQVALQLAYFSRHHCVAPAYESTSMAHWHHGRTETTRSLTSEVKEFVVAMRQAQRSGGDSTEAPSSSSSALPAKDKQRLFVLLKAACGSHSAYVRMAKAGQGVDRHLHALHLLAMDAAKEAISDAASAKRSSSSSMSTPATEAASLDYDPANDLPPLFTHPSFDASRHWALSTSNCGSDSTSLFGFGPVVPDGYGVGYSIRRDCITLNVTSWSAERQARYWEEVEEERRKTTSPSTSECTPPGTAPAVAEAPASTTATAAKRDLALPSPLLAAVPADSGALSAGVAAALRTLMGLCRSKLRR